MVEDFLSHGSKLNQWEIISRLYSVSDLYIELSRNFDSEDLDLPMVSQLMAELEIIISRIVPVARNPEELINHMKKAKMYFNYLNTPPEKRTVDIPSDVIYRYCLEILKECINKINMKLQEKPIKFFFRYADGIKRPGVGDEW